MIRHSSALHALQYSIASLVTLVPAAAPWNTEAILLLWQWEHIRSLAASSTMAKMCKQLVQKLARSPSAAKVVSVGKELMGLVTIDNLGTFDSCSCAGGAPQEKPWSNALYQPTGFLVPFNGGEGTSVTMHSVR